MDVAHAVEAGRPVTTRAEGRALRRGGQIALWRAGTKSTWTSNARPRLLPLPTRSPACDPRARRTGRTWPAAGPCGRRHVRQGDPVRHSRRFDAAFAEVVERVESRSVDPRAMSAPARSSERARGCP